MINAFRIGITVSLVNQGSAGLGILTRDFIKADAAAKSFETRLKSIKMMTLGGAALFGAGFLGLKGIEGLYNAAKGYEQAFARFQTLDLGGEINKQADQFARGTRVMGTSATDLMTTLTSLHTVLGNFGEARDLAPLIAKMEFANKAVFGDSPLGHKFDDRAAQAMAKVVEMRGGFRSEAEMMRQVDFMQHVMSGTGGMVMPADYLTFMKTGGLAARLQSNEVFYYQMEPLIQEMGGFRTGTALMSAYQNLAQGRTTQRTAMELLRLGLIPDRKMLEFSTTGKLLRIKPGGVAGGDLVGTDPMQFLQTVLLPAFAKHGITSRQAVENEIGTLFTNRTAAGLFTLLYQQQQKIAKNIGIDTNAAGVKEVTAEAENTPLGREIKAQKAWENLRIELGLTVIPLILPMLTHLATALQFLADVARDHPYLASFLTWTATGLSALAVVGGGLLLAKAGFDTVLLFLRAITLPVTSIAVVPGLATLGPTLMGVAAGLTAIGTAAAVVGGVYLVNKSRNEEFEAAAKKLGFAPTPTSFFNPIPDFVNSKTGQKLSWDEMGKLLGPPFSERVGGGGWLERWFKGLFGGGTGAPATPSSSLGLELDPWGRWRLPMGQARPSMPPNGTPDPQQGPTPPAGMAPPDPNHWGRPGPNEPLKAEISTESADRLTAMIAAAVRSGLAGVGIYIDGRELGSLVTQHQANEANRPPTTTSVPDIRLDPSYAMPGFAPAL